MTDEVIEEPKVEAEPVVETAPVVEEPAVEEPAKEEPVAEIETAPVETPKLEEEFEEFDLELSKDSLLSEKDLDAFVKEVEESDWSPEQAEGILRYREGMYKQAHDRVTSSQREFDEKGRSELMASPEYQPDQIENTFSKLREVNNKFGSESFAELMKGSLGNHKAISDLLLNVYKAIESQKNDSGGAPQSGHDITQGNSGTVPAEEGNSLKTMYPEFYK